MQSVQLHKLTGNLTKDVNEGIDSIYWNVYGKIASIKKQDTTIFYGYDASGNRISKTVTKPGSSLTTWYVRDASGNVMSVYTRGDNSQNGGQLTQTETHLYGSSRIGLFKPNNNVESPPIKSYILLPGAGPAYFQGFERGRKVYELTNHLGNVLTTVSDRRIAIDTNHNNYLDYYTADILSQQDYYPFGMLMQGRSFASSGYRYGFNGKENDNEVKGVGNQQDYGMRFYDPRVGRFLSVDPLTKSYPWYTPYQFAGNKPIWAVDLDGLEDRYYIVNIVRNGMGQVQLQNLTEDKAQAVHWYNDNATGKLGHGDLYTIRTETQDMDGKPISLVTTDIFVPKSTWLEKLSNAWSGDESGSERSGYVIYGKGHDMSWQKKLPRAGLGSESIDLGDWLNYFGGLRDGATPADLLQHGKLKNILDKIDKVREAIDKSNDFLEKYGEEKSNVEGPESSNVKTKSTGYSGYKKGTIIYTNTGNVRVDSDSTGTCCQDDKKATDTLPGLKKENK